MTIAEGNLQTEPGLQADWQCFQGSFGIELRRLQVDAGGGSFHMSRYN